MTDLRLELTDTETNPMGGAGLALGYLALELPQYVIY
jgi:hypothetical protein